jgi:zinc D-Ala-D-Ala carboxypeptidase
MPHPSPSQNRQIGPRAAIVVTLATVLVAAGVLTAPLVGRAVPSALRHLHGAGGTPDAPVTPVVEPTAAPDLGTLPPASGSGAGSGSGAALGEADGYIPSGTSIAPTADVAAITKLDPDLRAALQRAASDASGAGIDMVVTSGWRSTAYQQRLLDDAVARYGSVAEARRWVATPQTSAHVSGDAVDVGPVSADRWLERYGSRYGLCRIYANEIWHFQLATRAGGTCPALRADATEG